MKSTILILILICSVSNLTAHEPVKNTLSTGTLSGKIESQGELVPFASIFVQGTTIGVSADAHGQFNLRNIPGGNHIVVFSAVGYRTYSREVIIVDGNTVNLSINLEPDNIGIEQVVISANRNAGSRKESSSIVNSINPKLFDRMQSVTLSEGLNFTPGLRMENNCQNCGFSQVRMNGLEGPYTQILINSRPVFSGLAGVYGLELIPVNMIERVEVVRGGGSAMYGSNAIAGTINMITKDPINNTFSLSSSYGMTGTGISGFSTEPDFNLNANGSLVSEQNHQGLSFYGFHRKRNPYDANGDGFSELSSIDNTTFGSRLFRRTGTRGKISLDYFRIYEYRRGGNNFDKPLHESDIAESTTHRINSASLTFDQLFRDVDKLSGWISAVEVDRGSYYGANHDPSAYGQTDDLSLSTGVQYVRHSDNFLFAPATITSGTEYAFNQLKDKKNDYLDPSSMITVKGTQVAHQKINTFSAFSQSEWRLSSLLISAGLRFDKYQIDDIINRSGELTGNVLSPRISLLWHASEDLQFRTSFARGFRAPQIFDEDLHVETSGARQVLHKNDENLKQETSNSYSASMNYTHQTLFSQYQFLVEGFLTHLANPFSNEYGMPDEEGVVVYTRRNAEEGAVVKGINLELNISPSRRFQFQSGFTLQSSAYEAPQEFNEKRFFRSPEHYGYASMNWSATNRLELALSGNYTGSMLVPYFGPRLENPENGILVDSDSFFDTGIKMSYTFPILKLGKAQINAGIKNLFNSYQDDFDTGIDRDPAYIYGPGTPRTVYFGIKLGNF